MGLAAGWCRVAAGQGGESGFLAMSVEKARIPEWLSRILDVTPVPPA